MQALTKYPSGGGDVLMGSVTTRDEALHLRLKGAHFRFGWGVAGNDAELLLRSLPSLALRYAAHDRSATSHRRVAAAARRGGARAASGAARIRPGTPTGGRCAAVATRLRGCSRSSSTSAISLAQVDAFVDALRLFRIGYSWAGPVSLAVPYNLRAMRGASAPAAGLVRFSIGLEAADDLIADIEQALGALG